MSTLETVHSGHVVIGVDTHKHIHVAAVLDTIGGILATLTVPTDTGGFKQLLTWADSFGKVLAFGIEGTEDRLDCETLGSHLIDERDDQRLRGSSSPAKKIDAFRRIGGFKR